MKFDGKSFIKSLGLFSISVLMGFIIDKIYRKQSATRFVIAFIALVIGTTFVIFGLYFLFKFLILFFISLF